MVKSVEVKNFKSIADLKIELGRVNVFIGENGSGKSNILEAVAFGAAASANKLDKEFLASRGMRVPEPKLMRSAFDKGNLDKDVLISFEIFSKEQNSNLSEIRYKLSNHNSEFSKWIESTLVYAEIIHFLYHDFVSADLGSEQEIQAKANLKLAKVPDEVLDGLAKTKSDISRVKSNVFEFNLDDLLNNSFDESRFLINNAHPLLNRYKIYAPENSFLRKFEEEDASDPLGIKGEGLFRLLRYFQNHEDKKYINAIREALTALDWFEDFKIPDGLSSGERKLSIIDRFLDPDVSISQNSANEGFLFILFYISLFVSEDTPSFFAVDNVDASFNPKLCKHITQTLVNTAKKTNKQALFTTHNPFILDGLDLTDDEQRLFVVYRTQQGHTVAKRVEPNDRKMKLSDQWMNGFLGGLPENF